MQENQEQLTGLSDLGRIIEYKKQAVCLYNQAGKIMFGHSAHWSFTLREMGAQSQVQHDMLCKFTSGPIVLEAFTSVAIVEHPEEKDELALKSLDALYQLEQAILSITLGGEDREWVQRVQYAQSVSSYNKDWLKWVHNSFGKRFIATKDKTVVCALCGWRYEMKKGEDYEFPCPLCDGVHTLR